ncbi:TAF4 factor, partial [Polypterus senegalus]
MAAGSDLLDEVIFNTEVDERVVSDLVGSLESQLSGSSLGNSEIAAQAVGNHIGSSGAGGNTNVQEPKMGHAVDLAKAGSGVQGGVINNTRSPGAVVNATVGIITSATGSETAMVLSSSKPVTVNAMATPPVANHTAGNGKIGPVGVQTLNGSNVVVNSHGAGSAVTLVPSSSSSVSSSGSSSAPAVTVLNNGPATVGKASVSSNTVIQTSFVGAQHVTSPAISSQTSVTLVRPPVHTTNGSPVLSVGSGIPMQTTLPAGAAGTIKSESPKTIIQNAPPGVSLALQTVTPQQQQTVAVPKGGPVVHNLPRTNTPTAAAAPAAVNPGAIRTIAPQVLAPRLPPAPQNPPNIQNIQLPPGMVLVRSESGQLLMIHQQTLAQMQAQSQPQNTMTPRPATPSSSSSVQLSSVQAPGAPLIARQVTPTTIIKQPTQAQTTVQATSALQRSSVVQETLENVKKCKNFLSTLIKLASSGKQSSETAANVKDLVQNLLEGKIEAEDFTSRLYQELHSSPQPYLVPFLKRSLPALRQLTPDSAAFIQQSQVQQPIAQATTALTSVTLGSPIQRSAGKAIATVTSTLQQPVISLSQTGHNKPGQTAPLDDERSEQVSDVRSQLKFFEQLDHLEKQRKEEQEREILLKAAKSRSRQEDPEQLRLKQKAKEMQQQELAQMRQRDANLTALAAIGPRKKRKVDLPGPGAITEHSPKHQHSTINKSSFTLFLLLHSSGQASSSSSRLWFPKKWLLAPFIRHPEVLQVLDYSFPAALPGVAEELPIRAQQLLLQHPLVVPADPNRAAPNFNSHEVPVGV